MSEQEVKPVCIVCDWNDADPFPRFIEAEVDGKSVSIPWHHRADGLMELHLYDESTITALRERAERAEAQNAALFKRAKERASAMAKGGAK